MRLLCDGHLRSSEEGRRLITEYYRTAPAIVKAIEASPIRDETYSHIYGAACNCAALVDTGDFETANRTYLEMIGNIQGIVSQIE
ncbi:MAG: hypothetical protein IKG18_14325 [Atopobiaceae bacterium]|nr:hypothetical protein [Atopobiaceae bacterium]